VSRKYDYDPDLILEAAKGARSMADVATRRGIDSTSFSKYLSRNPDLKADVLAAIGGHYHASRRDGAPVTSPGATTVSAEVTELGDIERMLTARGLNAQEWRVVRARVNEWGAGKCPACETTVEPLEQTRVDLDPRGDVLMPARKDGPRWKWPKQAALKAGDRVAFLADPHCPFEDRRALAAFRGWLDRIGGVQKIVVLGDVLDLGSLSRWPKQPGQPNGNDCLEAGYEWLRELRDIAPDTQIVWLVGNHDVRIENTARDSAPELMTLRRRGTGELLLGLGFALGLDELAVDLVSPQEGWEVAELSITPKLAAWHAPPAKSQRDVLTYSVVHAHHHAMTWDTTPQLAQGNITVGRKQVVGVASMARIKTGMNYTKAPRWGQGWAWADVWDDGEHEISHVRYHDGTAWWPGGRLRVAEVPAWRGRPS